MAKKTARPTNTKPAQQRSKEEQWRKRMAAQARTTGTTLVPTNGAGSAIAESDDEVLDDTVAGQSAIPVPAASSARTATATRAQATSAARSSAARSTSASSAAVRRPLPPRGRLAQANALSVEDEMHFIKRDIQKLVVLTIICLAIIIILAFIVPQFVK